MAPFMVASVTVFFGSFQATYGKAFHNKSYGFTISFPSSWTVNSRIYHDFPIGTKNNVG